jgi:chromate transporter
LAGDALWQIVVLLGGAAVGLLVLRNRIEPSEVCPTPRHRSDAWIFLLVFALLLGLWPVAARAWGSWVEASEGFYRAGSLVFGGGHVILPLLDAFTVQPGWVDSDHFLAGYGAAQALPGPLFTFAGFLGASMSIGPGAVPGGILAIVAINLPSWLLVLGVLPYWEKIRSLRSARAALRGTNAAVVGLLIAAFYDPIWAVAVTDATRFACALVLFALLRFTSIPPWLLVIGSALGGAVVWGS